MLPLVSTLRLSLALPDRSRHNTNRMPSSRNSEPLSPISDSGAQNGAGPAFGSLEQREKELADFVENAAVSLHRVGEDGTILWANRAELTLLGYAPEEYVGHNIAEFHVDTAVIEDVLRRLKG